MSKESVVFSNRLVKTLKTYDKKTMRKMVQDVAVEGVRLGIVQQHYNENSASWPKNSAEYLKSKRKRGKKRYHLTGATMKQFRNPKLGPKANIVEKPFLRVWASKLKRRDNFLVTMSLVKRVKGKSGYVNVLAKLQKGLFGGLLSKWGFAKYSKEDVVRKVKSANLEWNHLTADMTAKEKRKKFGSYNKFVAKHTGFGAGTSVIKKTGEMPITANKKTDVPLWHGLIEKYALGEIERRGKATGYTKKLGK